MVASPIEESVRDLEALGKKLKKNQIAIDVINLGTIGLTQANRETSKSSPPL